MIASAESGAFLVTMALVVSGSLAVSQQERSLRLPNETYPIFYQLHISSDIHKGTLDFFGNATIDIAVRQSTNEIVLHAKNLSDIQITVLQLTDEGSVIVPDLTHTLHHSADFLIIHPRKNYQAFEKGQRYHLEILYKSTMASQPGGLYYMDYWDQENNRTSYIAATQSEPTMARLIFPCYDEPGFKSNFSIKVTHGRTYSALSNMPVKEILTHGELKTTLFLTTPPISTYLVAIVISDFESISETYRGVTQSIYTSPTSKEKGRSALKNVVRTLAAFEDYFGISFPLPKLDHVALKYAMEGMENWGLVTYKEANLLQNVSTTKNNPLWGQTTQSHEIAHQWFGDLVSPEWWSYTWLNEGFAKYFSNVITDLLYPDYKIMDVFISEEANSVYTDGHSIRPMTYYVEEDIMKVFDSVSYYRAAYVIRMFHNAFRQKAFVRGISHFLEKYRYSVANEQNLFDALQERIQEDENLSQKPWASRIREIMLSWTHSEGVPMVMVARNYENNSITFSQTSNLEEEELWWIPLNFATSRSPTFETTQADIFMPPQSQYSVSLKDLNMELSATDWIIVNKQETGFYRVNYDTDNLMAIARQLQTNHSVIHRINRAGLFLDLNPLIYNSKIEKAAVVLEMLKYLEIEEDMLIWEEAKEIISWLTESLFEKSSQSLLNEFVRRLVGPIFTSIFLGQSLKVSPEKSDEILKMACFADLPECLAYTKRLAKEYFINKQERKLASASRSLIDLCMGIRAMSDQEFHTNVLQMTKVQPEYSNILYGALLYRKSHQHILEYMEILLGNNSTHNKNPKSTGYLVIIYKYNPYSQPIIWEYIERNYRWLCLSPDFLDHFEILAGLVPRHQKTQFARVREIIAKYMKAEDLNSTQNLIESDSPLVGKGAERLENFQDKYEQQIHNWLLDEISQLSAQSKRASRGG
ncbi:aminopeptidase N-like [Drosophila takahashii]|uniref:aminopeptidase N-like n=1 Tax=Drosophila takahashii TaxID=29030 RepID=UPI001CF7EF93|nr:endoplasmic reticulum aminopeptidase 2-like [Drosophila takahashii]